MASNPFGSSSARSGGPLLSTRNLLIAATAAAGLALLMALTLGERLVPLRVVLILTGLGLALGAVNQRLRNFAEDLEGRGLTAACLTVAAFVVLLAFQASSEAWDTFRLVLGVFVGVGLTGALLVMLPQWYRRVAILLLVLFHFGGILTAVFSVPPPSGLGCWTTNALWTYIYRPYLQFMYLNNAYHFYSPEPGPATQLWFCVRYEDPNVPPRWIQVPRREDYPSRLLYQRATALTESTGLWRGYPDDIGQRILHRSQKKDWIPYLPDLQNDKTAWMVDPLQYREPIEVAGKKYVASYARHVARDKNSRSADAPDSPVKSVKVYRVLHTMLSAQEMAINTDPEDPIKMWPFYMGEFDSDGKLLDPDDPLLYWAVPILPEPDGKGSFVTKNYVAVHAGCEVPFLHEHER
jgi:hypothetical protein